MSDDPREKRRRAVAVRYQAGEDDAPKVVAKGTGLLADRILEIAREHGVHVYEDPDLVEVLARLDIQQDIPPEMYKAVAEVLAFVYRINQQVGDRKST